MSTIFSILKQEQPTTAIFDSIRETKLTIPRGINDYSTSKIKIPLQANNEDTQDNSTFLQEINNVTNNLSSINSIIEYEINEDPMKNLSGKDAENIKELLQITSIKNNLEILKGASFKDNSVSFKLDVKFKEE